MTELHIPTLIRLAKKQFRENGRVGTEILDLVIEDWQIDLTGFKDQKRARELWRNLITLYLIDNKEYIHALGYIKGIHDAAINRKKVKENNPEPDLPDIVA